MSSTIAEIVVGVLVVINVWWTDRNYRDATENLRLAEDLRRASERNAENARANLRNAKLLVTYALPTRERGSA